MKFTLPGLMPTLTPVADNVAVTEVKLLGDQPLFLEVNLGQDVTDKELVLLLENQDASLGEVPTAITVVTAEEGIISIGFGASMASIVTLDTGHHVWIVAEIVEGVYRNLKLGTVYRARRQD